MGFLTDSTGHVIQNFTQDGKEEGHWEWDFTYTFSDATNTGVMYDDTDHSPYTLTYDSVRLELVVKSHYGYSDIYHPVE